VRGRGVVGALALVLLAGCSDVAAQDATAAARAFVQAAPPEACGLLAPQTARSIAKSAGNECAPALAALDLPTATAVRQVEIAGESAQVQLEDQVVFLAHFPDGWRVTAAGCVRDDPDPAVPYECEVEP
jgi:uncharacterized protein YceK